MVAVFHTSIFKELKEVNRKFVNDVQHAGRRTGLGEFLTCEYARACTLMVQVAATPRAHRTGV